MRKKPPKSQLVAEALQRLVHTPEWKAFADLYFEMREKWKSQLMQFHSGNTLEAIAIERVRLAARMEGTEMLFSEVNNLIESLEERDAGRE